MPRVLRALVVLISILSTHSFLNTFRSLTMGFDLKAALAAADAPKITAFDRKVYEACSRVPKGKVSTYKDIARVIGSEGAFRAVGSSLKRNPFAPQVPCHRVVSSDLSLGGFHGSTDPRGAMLQKKRAMLCAEGVSLAAARGKTRSDTTVPPAVGKSAGRKRKLAQEDSVVAEDEAQNTAHVRVAPASVYRFD